MTRTRSARSRPSRCAAGPSRLCHVRDSKTPDTDHLTVAPGTWKSFVMHLSAR
ncbi:DUF397 domain-containing protein [Streptomyces sp. NPDC093591]|uniref:DUF397 domain-containing protein n=1 Tax=Streptomyces sp. NPDC093591 TaxID=3366044 RepID=UPI0037F14DC2